MASRPALAVLLGSTLFLMACGGPLAQGRDGDPFNPVNLIPPQPDAGAAPQDEHDAGSLDADAGASGGGGGGAGGGGPASGGGSGGGTTVEDAGLTDGGQPPGADAGTVSAGTCTREGALFCGGNGIGGNPGTLYQCHAGAYLPHQVCAGACRVMPKGISDLCPTPIQVPASLVTLLGPKPYVEEQCVPTTFTGWPYPAQACTYTSGGITTTVKVANPSADRVARWVVDSASDIPALARLKGTAQPQYEEGLKAIGLAMLYQSSRIFPLSGGIIENMGTGYVNYPFLDGITQGCTSGCYCRINSLHRTEWCNYRAAFVGQTYAQCLAGVGSAGLTTAWGSECLNNHKQAWTQDFNEHFRAKAFIANQTVAGRCPTAASCTPAQVVSAVKNAFGL